MAQRIIDLDAAIPAAIGVQIDGEIYDLPGDIPIPDLIALERAVADLEDPESTTPATVRMETLYEQVLDLFRVRQPDLEDLPLGPERLGALIVGIYTKAADEDDAEAAPGKAKPRGGTRSTSKTRSKRSRGSK